MQSLLSQSQTPTESRNPVGFFGSGCPCGSLRRADYPAYFGL